MLRLLTLSFLVATTITATGNAQDADDRTVPARWHGEWNEDLSACGKHTNASELVISEDRIEFWESGGIVRGAFQRGPFEILIVADMSGEGQTWLTSYSFTMSSSGGYIQMDLGDGSRFTRYRCGG